MKMHASLLYLIKDTLFFFCQTIWLMVVSVSRYVCARPIKGAITGDNKIKCVRHTGAAVQNLILLSDNKLASLEATLVPISADQMTNKGLSVELLA